MLSLSICRKHSTAQRNHPFTKPQKQAGKVSESQHVVEHYTARCLLKTSKEIEVCTTYKLYKHSQAVSGVMREGFPFISNLN